MIFEGTLEQELEAWLSTMVTVELCAEIHSGEGRDEAIRNCCKRIVPRLIHVPRIYRIFYLLSSNHMAGETLCLIRQGLEEVAGGTVEFG